MKIWFVVKTIPESAFIRFSDEYRLIPEPMSSFFNVKIATLSPGRILLDNKDTPPAARSAP